MPKYADGHIRNQIQGPSLSSQLQYVFDQEWLCAHAEIAHRKFYTKNKVTSAFEFCFLKKSYLNIM